MGADWYSTTVLYGCTVNIPSGSTHGHVLRRLETILQRAGPSAFRVDCLISEIHSRMEGMDDYEHNEMTERSDIILGFYPPDDLSKLMELAEQLKEFVGIFADYTFGKPSFHTGICWYPREDAADDDDDDDDDETEVPTYAPAKTLTAEEIHAMFYSS